MQSRDEQPSEVHRRAARCCAAPPSRHPPTQRSWVPGRSSSGLCVLFRVTCDSAGDSAGGATRRLADLRRLCEFKCPIPCGGRMVLRCGAWRRIVGAGGNPTPLGARLILVLPRVCRMASRCRDGISTAGERTPPCARVHRLSTLQRLSFLSDNGTPPQAGSNN